MVDETDQIAKRATKTKTKKGKKSKNRKQSARKNLTRYRTLAKEVDLLEPIQEKLEISSDEEEKMAVKSDPKTKRSRQAPEKAEKLICVACQTYDDGVKCASCQYKEIESELVYWRGVSQSWSYLRDFD